MYSRLSVGFRVVLRHREAIDTCLTPINTFPFSSVRSVAKRLMFNNRVLCSVGRALAMASDNELTGVGRHGKNGRHWK